MNMRLKKTCLGAVTKLFGDSQGFVTLPVLRGPARGLRFSLELVNRMETAYFKGTYDYEILLRLSQLCIPGWTVWDCGVYLGFYTVFLSRLVGRTGRVVAVEPDPTNIERAKRNCALNQCANVEFVSAAVADATGTHEFVINSTSNSHLPDTYIGRNVEEYRSKPTDTGQLVSVRSLTLDSLLDETREIPQLVKIDIEGAESRALQAIDVIAEQIRPLILLELHNPECDRAAWDFGRRYRYSLENIVTGEPQTRKEDVHGTLLCRPIP